MASEPDAMLNGVDASDSPVMPEGEKHWGCQ